MSVLANNDIVTPSDSPTPKMVQLLELLAKYYGSFRPIPLALSIE